MRIKQTAEILGISVDTLRVWERKGILNPKRTALGHRIYSEEDILRLQNLIRSKGHASSPGKRG